MTAPQQPIADDQLAIVVLAAGAGTRMRSATPKLLHEIAGLPLLSHVLATARRLGAAHTVAVVRHERERVAEVVHADSPDAVVVDQDDVPGTGRAVEVALAALPVGFGGDVLVVNGDVPLLDAATLQAVVTAHRASGASATLLSALVADPTGYGRIVRDGSGALDRVVEHRDASAEELAIAEINAGVYLFRAAGFGEALAAVGTANAQGEKYLTDVVAVLRERGAAVAAVPVEEWLVRGVNDRVQLAEAAALLNAMIVRGHQLAGVTVRDPATTWIDLAVTIAPDVEILPNTHLQGATRIETGAVVGPDTTLTDTEVGEDAVVTRTDGSLAVIGARASVGPFAYLRPGTVLGEDGKIGTFVETKNVVIGRGSKVPHLTYAGDAEIGAHTNIGAGAVFANYDGVAKHRSTIGDHVHTGSKNVFVAPVRIGDGAYTAAGAIIRKDVPVGSLAMSVAPQRNIEGWTVGHRPGTEAARVAAESGTGDQ